MQGLHFTDKGEASELSDNSTKVASKAARRRQVVAVTCHFDSEFKGRHHFSLTSKGRQCSMEDTLWAPQRSLAPATYISHETLGKLLL